MPNSLYIGLSERVGAFIQTKERMPRIYQVYIRLALITCTIYPVVMILLGKVQMEPLDLFLSFLPAFTCLLSEFFLRFGWVDATWFMMFIAGPISITGRYIYGTINGLQLIVLFTAILSFFLVARKTQIIAGYLVSILSLCTMHILLEYRMGYLQNQDIWVLCFGLIIFACLLFYVLVLLRSVIYKYHRERSESITALHQTNQLLDIKNNAISEQLALLSEKNRIISNAADFHKKIMSILSHDVKDSILPIKYLIHGYQKGLFRQEDFSRYFQTLSSEIDKMHLLFEEILSLATLPDADTPEQKMDIPVACLAADVIGEFSLAQKEKRLHFINQIGKEIVINANEKITKIIFRNLISNAVKFSFPDGRITLSCSRENHYYRISVQDEGIGISAGDIRKILSGKTVQTTGTGQEKGTGLGLQFCRDFIGRAGGSFDIDSRKNGGTIVSFTVPAL